MFSNTIKITIKNLLANKLYSALNIVGLATGIAACITIALYVQDESSYDKHWKNADQIFRVNRSILLDNVPRRSSGNSLLLAPSLSRYFSEEIEFSSRLMSLQQDISFENSTYSETIYTADRGFIEMFDFEVLAGSLTNTLEDINSIAITEQLATTLFGTLDPIGKIVSLRSAGVVGVNKEFRVTAVYKLPPENSVLQLPALILFDMSYFPWGENWGIMTTHSYFQLRENSDVDSLSSLLQSFTDQNVDISGMGRSPDTVPSDIISYDLQNISDLYLNSSFDELTDGGNKTTVMAFTAISVLVLMIASINFMVLTIAKATQRSKEVALRKVLGAHRHQLVIQFLGESFLMVFLSILAALAIIELVLPLLQTEIGKSLEFDYTSSFSYLLLLSLLLFVGSAGGIYPAIVLSRFNPSNTLKVSQSAEPIHSINLRNFLVVIQFSVSIALIISTLVIFGQMRFIGERDPGFNKENLIAISNLLFRSNVNENKFILKNEILNLPNVTDASLSIHQPTQQLGMANIYPSYTISGGTGSNHQIGTLSIDQDFFATYQIEFLAGRNLSLERDTLIVNNDSSVLRNGSIILNASAVREFGFLSPEDAVGRQITAVDSGNSYTVIGVVKDTDFFNLRSIPRAEIYNFNPQFTDVLTVRFTGDELLAISEITDLWNSIIGGELIQSSTVEQLMSQEFSSEEIEAKILTSFSLLAVIIASLGLFGSASYSVDRRKREIGIRKVLGAKVREIVRMLVWYFSKPVLIANLFAWPLALWLMIQWLEQFPYQIDRWVLLLVCLFSGVVALAIAWVTIASKSLIAALDNPVNSIRCE